MPNILDIPMKKAEKITVSATTAYAKFTGKKAHIEIKSTLNRGIQINSRLKSEQVSIGINDYYLASTTFRRRSFPIYIILSVFLGLFGLFLGWFSLSEAEDEMMVVSLLLLFVSLICIGLYFYTRIARLSFRLSDDQDYDILLASSAVTDSQGMQVFIEKLLMNALKVEDETIYSTGQQTVDQSAVFQAAPVALQPVAAQPVAPAVFQAAPPVASQAPTPPVGQYPQ